MYSIRQKLAVWLSGRPGLRDVLANSGWLMFERIVRLALALLVGAWVARYLGPQQYGVLAYIVALVAVWQALASLGLEAVVVRELAHDHISAAAILGTAFCLRLSAAVLCWLGVLLTTVFLVPDDGVVLRIALVLGCGLVFQIADLVDQWFQSQTQSRHAVGPRLGAAIGAALIKVGMILVEAPLWAFAIALLFDSLLAAAVLTWVYKRRATPKAWQFERARARNLLNEAWPLLIAGLSVVVYMRIDLLLLHYLAGEEQVGLYAAVAPLSAAFHMLPMTVCASVMPRLSVLGNTDPDRYRKHMQQLFVGMAWIGIAVAGLTTLTAPWIIRFLLGPAFEAAIPVLQWHAWTNVFVFLGVAQSVAIMGDRTPRIALYRTLFGVMVSICANWLLVPRWGAIGAAWSAILSQFCAAILSNAFLAPQYLKMQARVIWPFRIK